MFKRGISGVVTAILLILLAIAAVIIVWSVVKPLIEKPAESAQTDCITVDLAIVSATNDGTTSAVVVKRNPGAGDLTAITVRVIDDAGNAKTVPCALTGTGGKLAELETQTCTIGALTGIGTWETVEVYANVGNQKTLCSNFESTKTIDITP